MKRAVVRGVTWVGSSRDEVRAFPQDARRAVGLALYQAQVGGKHPLVRPLKGFAGAGVLEVIQECAGGAFRCVYAVRFAEAVYVLHAFHKKSNRGIATPKHDLDMVRSRLTEAEQIHAGVCRPDGGANDGQK